MASEKLDQLKAHMKEAMKSGEKEKLATIRLVLAQVKQFEVDERQAADNATVVRILKKMTKQRKESITQFQNAKRDDLVQKETFELGIINSYLPQPLTEAEVTPIVNDVIEHYSPPATIKDMGKLMAILKEKLGDRADLSLVSQLIKEKLS